MHGWESHLQEVVWPHEKSSSSTQVCLHQGSRDRNMVSHRQFAKSTGGKGKLKSTLRKLACWRTAAGHLCAASAGRGRAAGTGPSADTPLRSGASWERRQARPEREPPQHLLLPPRPQPLTQHGSSPLHK